MDFKTYVESSDYDPIIWEAPMLIIQLDSLLNLVCKNSYVMEGEGFEFSYDLIVLDESESLMSYVDEGTMNNTEIEIWFFFNEIMKHSKKIVLMDGDISQRSLRLDSSYGGMLYVRRFNNETNKATDIINGPATWEAGLLKDIDEFRNSDPNFRICIVSQSSKQAMSINEDLVLKFPELKIWILIG